ncbi:MAG: heparan-alpha-glucosaminide N-acetyltransferase [Pseudomonadota bacterium]
MPWVDQLRGLAIVLMVIFHFCYDLRYFGYADWDVPDGAGWWQFRFLILTLFITTLGVSLYLAHADRVRWRKYVIRLALLVLSAAAITLMSLFLFPTGWIYFGILHFMAVATVLGIAFVVKPRLAFFVGLSILVFYWTGTVTKGWPFAGLSWVPDYTEDYVSLFPWLGVALVGIGLGPTVRSLPRFHLPVAGNALGLLGKHALLIYLVHQPIFFAGFLSVGWLSA